MSDHSDFIKAIINYVTKKFGNRTKVTEIKDLGSGLVADGYKVSLALSDGTTKDIVCRRLHTTGMSHDYLSDRIGYLMHQHDIAQSHPDHTKSLDVVVYGNELDTVSMDGVSDTFHVMEFASGKSYLEFIKRIGKYKTLQRKDRKIVENIADYLSELHSLKPVQLTTNERKHLYWRHSQDYIGSEVYLDIIDVWPDNYYLNSEDKSEILGLLSLKREETKNRYSRICRIHADFHPDNIRIKKNFAIEVLDATRAKWGEAADDVSCILANYIYYSIKQNGKLSGSYKQVYDILTSRYLHNTSDIEIQKYIPLYLSVRLLIVAHPLFFVDNTEEEIKMLVDLAKRLLRRGKFEFSEIYTLL